MEKFAGKDFKYMLLLPDADKAIGSLADYYTYYIDHIIFSEDIWPRGMAKDEDCKYYGRTEPDLNSIGETVYANEIRIQRENNGCVICWGKTEKDDLSVYDTVGRLVFFKKISDVKSLFLPLRREGLYVAKFRKGNQNTSTCFLY